MYLADQRFENTNFAEKPLPGKELDGCVFVNCNFERCNLSGVVFAECEFVGCNLSLANLKKTALKEVSFKDCKLLGLRFEECQEFLFAVRFDKCVLNHSSFYNWKLKKTLFRDSSLQEVDFSGADLTESVLDNCDLKRATFASTNLEKADFRTAYNYLLDPEQNRIKKAKFAVPGVLGLLSKYDIRIE